MNVTNWDILLNSVEVIIRLPIEKTLIRPLEEGDVNVVMMETVKLSNKIHFKIGATSEKEVKLEQIISTKINQHNGLKLILTWI